ncbi:hypothetical protein AUJ69_00435 [Candidatus Woesearchaeota archaeon CG1_02_47_18]|nr:MAG: hypothetical protein AUJ69_00435 [Candidatus Woesearchaeota archaeon CG1_02_47_18]
MRALNAVIPPACSANTRVPFGHEKSKRFGLPYGKYGYLGLLDLPSVRVKSSLVSERPEPRRGEHALGQVLACSPSRAGGSLLQQGELLTKKIQSDEA